MLCSSDAIKLAWSSSGWVPQWCKSKTLPHDLIESRKWYVYISILLKIFWQRICRVSIYDLHIVMICSGCGFTLRFPLCGSNFWFILEICVMLWAFWLLFLILLHDHHLILCIMKNRNEFRRWWMIWFTKDEIQPLGLRYWMPKTSNPCTLVEFWYLADYLWIFEKIKFLKPT